jgi:hypothetical protein
MLFSLLQLFLQLLPLPFSFSLLLLSFFFLFLLVLSSFVLLPLIATVSWSSFSLPYLPCLS